jgi:hypothetical protein
MGRVLALVGVTVVLLGPGAALAAGSSTCEAYNPQLCSSVESGHTGTGVPSASPSSAGKASTLPSLGSTWSCSLVAR